MKIADQNGEAALGNNVLHVLREDIITGVLEPGRWLRLVDLRQRYDAGASPLREALSKLAAEQLVVQEANRGFRVPPLDEAEFMDLFSLRRQLEPSAVAQSVALGDVAWEDDLVLAHRRLKRLGPPDDKPAGEVGTELARQWEQAHRRFHDALIAACASPWTLHFCNVLNDQFDRYRRFARPHAKDQMVLSAQHDEMLTLALARNADACAELLEAHVAFTGNRVLEVLKERLEHQTMVPPSTSKS